MNEAFVGAFLSSAASKYARSRGKSSADSPEAYLKRVRMTRHRRDKKRQLAARLGEKRATEQIVPEEIYALFSLQNSDGSWENSPGFTRALLGPGRQAQVSLPECPLPSVASRLWMTAMAVCRIRYQNLPYELKEDAVKRGIGALQGDERLLELAQDALPPYRFAAALPAETVRYGLWKEATADIVETLGYNALQQRIDEAKTVPATPGSAASATGRPSTRQSQGHPVTSNTRDSAKAPVAARTYEQLESDTARLLRSSAVGLQPDAAAVNRELLALIDARQPGAADAPGGKLRASRASTVTGLARDLWSAAEAAPYAVRRDGGPREEARGEATGGQSGVRLLESLGSVSTLQATAGDQDFGRQARATQSYPHEFPSTFVPPSAAPSDAGDLKSLPSEDYRDLVQDSSNAQLPHGSSVLAPSREANEVGASTGHVRSDRGFSSTDLLHGSNESTRLAQKFEFARPGIAQASLAERMRLRSEAALQQIGEIRSEALAARQRARRFVSEVSERTRDELHEEEEREEKLRRVEWRFAKHAAGAVPLRQGEHVECFFRRPRMDAPPGLSYADDWPLRRRYCTQAYLDEVSTKEKTGSIASEIPAFVVDARKREEDADEVKRAAQVGKTVYEYRKQYKLIAAGTEQLLIQSKSSYSQSTGSIKSDEQPGVGRRKGHPAVIAEVLHGGFVDLRFTDGPKELLKRIPASFVLRRGQNRSKYVPGRGSLDDMLLLSQPNALRRIWGVVPREFEAEGDSVGFGSSLQGVGGSTGVLQTTPRVTKPELYVDSTRGKPFDHSTTQSTAAATVATVSGCYAIGAGIAGRVPKYKRETRRLQRLHADFAAKQEAGWDGTFIRVEPEHVRRAKEAKASAIETAKVEARFAMIALRQSPPGVSMQQRVPQNTLGSLKGVPAQDQSRKSATASNGSEVRGTIDLRSALAEIRLAQSTSDSLHEERIAKKAQEELELLHAFRKSEESLGRGGAVALAKYQGIDLVDLEASVKVSMDTIQMLQSRSKGIDSDEHSEAAKASMGSIGRTILPSSTGAGKELFEAAMLTDRMLVQLKVDLTQGERTWLVGGRLQDRHEAFAPLTRTLKLLRAAVVTLVSQVRLWQGLAAEPSWHLSKSLDDVNNPEDAPASATEGQVASASSKPAHKAEDDESVPPFIWNGIVYLPALTTALDPLGRSLELRRWFGPEYPFLVNPLSLPWSLKEHPSTPAAVQSWVRIAGTVEKRVVPELLAHHKRAVEERRRWRAAFEVEKGPVDLEALLVPAAGGIDAELASRQQKLAEGLENYTRFIALAEKHGHAGAYEMLGLGQAEHAGSSARPATVGPLPSAPGESPAGAAVSLGRRRRRRASVSMVDMDGNPFEVEVAGTGSEAKLQSVVSNTAHGRGRRCAWWWPAAGMGKSDISDALVACAGLIDAAMRGR